MHKARHVEVLGLATVGAVFGAVIVFGFAENLWFGLLALTVFAFVTLVAAFES
jgi:hypothetical protein